MSKRVWVVGVGNWWDKNKQKFDPVMFPDCGRALAYIEFCKDYDREIGRVRKFKLQSYSMADKWFEPYKFNQKENQNG